ncbi:hypothetical protein [Mycoplasma hafezii]|uniref:hypothetical protein n=1 Tax=Mycoplasma hafezii TaxID=525886 RepID=UPI003CE6D278
MKIHLSIFFLLNSIGSVFLIANIILLANIKNYNFSITNEYILYLNLNFVFCGGILVFGLLAFCWWWYITFLWILKYWKTVIFIRDNKESYKFLNYYTKWAYKIGKRYAVKPEICLTEKEILSEFKTNFDEQEAQTQNQTN